MQTTAAPALSDRDRRRLCDAHREYRLADEAFERAAAGEARESAGALALASQQALLRLMLALGVGDLAEALTPEELADLLG
jgi:hypothetical protein